MIFLDTHAWIWWVTESEKLSTKAIQAICDADTVGVSIMSCWEVAMLVEKKRIGLTMDVEDWLAYALERPKIRLHHLDTKIVVRSTRFSGSGIGDPVDRLLIAAALSEAAALVTKDEIIRKSQLVQVIW
jgi:PIN domain nuclease of toxin-antitoxin system